MRYLFFTVLIIVILLGLSLSASMQTPTLQPAQMTATSLVSTFIATQTIGAGGIPSTVVPGQPSPYPTAIRIPTSTPIPTMTEREKEERKADLIDSFETAFGFSHPIFQEIAEGIVQEELNRDEYGQYFLGYTEVHRTTFNGSLYVAGIIENRFFIHGQFFSFAWMMVFLCC